MSDEMLSQEEIQALLNTNVSEQNNENSVNQVFSDIEKDLLGEIGNISMGSAATALSTIIGHKVNITTPVVSMTTLEELKKTFEVPNVALEVKFTTGIVGGNLLVMKLTDAAVVSNLMMGGDGKVDEDKIELSEIELSAVSEAMNQMIGSAATSMATMLTREINISPPDSRIWDDTTTSLSRTIDEKENIVVVSFRLKIGELIDSTIMQILPVDTSKKIVSVMTGSIHAEEHKQQSIKEEDSKVSVNNNFNNIEEKNIYENMANNEQQVHHEKVEVSKASFQELNQAAVTTQPRNIDLILDVPLEISVVLGRSKKNIKEILNLGTGSLVELDKLAEEPVEILVNGKKIAYGEVVVVDENFGVRITNIVDNKEKLKSLGN